ncbi:unnamed protein product, partial [Ixodes persulcatus]
VAGNYNFGYDESHSSGGSFRRESGNFLGVKTGSYGLHNADGRVRVVNYVADGAGFRASIATNEPGTVPSSAADATYSLPSTPHAAKISTGPALPVAPVAPVASPIPVTPVANVAQVASVVPVAPIAPLAPVAPIAPIFGAHPAYLYPNHGSFHSAFGPLVSVPESYGNTFGYGLAGYGIDYFSHVNHLTYFIYLKVFIILALVAGASAGVVENTVAESGVSTQHRTQDELGNYNFGYDERHTSGGSWRKESGDANGNTVGSYGLTDADGRVRVVHYVADSHGFRASVATNEPGTAPSSPSGVGINAPMGPTGPHGDVTLDGVSLSVAPIDVAATPAVSLADASPVAVPAPVAYAAAAAAPITRVAVAAPQVTYRAPEVTYAASQVNYATAPVARVAVAAPQVTYNAPQIVYAAAAAPRITFAAAPVTRVAYASAPYGRVTYGGPFRVSSVSHQIAAAAAPVSYTDVAPAAVKFANLGPAEVATHAAATRVATYAVPAPVFRRVVPIEFVGAGQAYLGGHGKYGR